MIAERYERGSLLGRGGGGAVYRAFDHRTGDTVALKILVGLDAAARHRLRRELAALRWLQMPGVVRLRDDGPLEEDWFIAMDLVPGAPFPGLPTPAPWEELRGPTLALVELLGRVHAAGVIHRDLKPANVLVHNGQPTLLDFGVSRGASLARGAAGVEHSPRWAAPEQIRGEDEDLRTDLYSLGRVIEEALDPRRAPPALLATLRRLLAPQRARRPASAAEVYRALGGEPRPPRLKAAAPHPDAMSHLFEGGDLFEHNQEDAAALLFARTDGEQSRVEAELDRWVDLGIARELGGVLAVDRVGLDRVAEELSGFQPLAFTRRALAGRSAGPALQQLAGRAAEQMAEGRPALAQATLAVGLGLARAIGASERSLLSSWVCAALAQESIGPIERALYEIERADRPDPALEALLHGARAAYRGEGVRAQELLGALGTLEDPALESWRQGLRVRAASRIGIDEEQRVLDELGGWAAADPAAMARLSAWNGNLRYRQGRYAEAAALQRQAADGAATADRRLAARLNAALALLELHRLEEVRALAVAAAQEAAALRNPVYEGYATFYLRAADYRAGLGGPCRPELVSAAARVRPHLAAQLALNEAANAWRAGDLAQAGSLARRGEALFSQLGHGEPAALCGALALAAGATGASPRLPARWQVPDLGAQTLGLLAIAGDPPVGWRADIRALIDRLPGKSLQDRLDVLALGEALEARLTGPEASPPC